MEHEFLSAIHDMDWQNFEDLALKFPLFADSLDENYRNRVFIYRSGYVGRVTRNLANSVYFPASTILGLPFVESVLASYFESNRATNAVLSNAADGFWKFSKEFDSFVDFPWLSDVFRYCELRWRLLSQKDPTIPSIFAANQLDIMDSRLLFPVCFLTSQYPLYDLLESSVNLQNGSSSVEVNLGLSQSLLLIRPSVFDFSKVVVSRPLRGFVEDLVNGKTIEQALESLQDTEQVEEEVDLQRDLTALIHTLTTLGALGRS